MAAITYQHIPSDFVRQTLGYQILLLPNGQLDRIKDGLTLIREREGGHRVDALMAEYAEATAIGKAIRAYEKAAKNHASPDTLHALEDRILCLAGVEILKASQPELEGETSQLLSQIQGTCEKVIQAVEGAEAFRAYLQTS